MKISTIFSLLSYCIYVHAQHKQKFFTAVDLESNLVTCENGAPPSITCADPTPDISNTACSCKCSNGLLFTQPIPRPGPSPDEDNALLPACEATKSQCLTDLQNSAQRQESLQNELSLAKQQCMDDIIAGMQREADLNQQLAALKREMLDKEQDHTNVETELRVQLAAVKQTCFDEATSHNQRETELRDQITALKAQHLSETQSLETLIKSLTAQLSTCQSNAAPKPKVYTYAGCYVDSNNRVFNRKSGNDNSLTNKRCEAMCAGYKYYATQNANYCSCGDVFAAPTQQVADSQCNMGCVGNQSEKCGGAWRNSVYERRD